MLINKKKSNGDTIGARKFKKEALIIEQKEALSLSVVFDKWFARDSMYKSFDHAVTIINFSLTFSFLLAYASLICFNKYYYNAKITSFPYLTLFIILCLVLL